MSIHRVMADALKLVFRLKLAAEPKRDPFSSGHKRQCVGSCTSVCPPKPSATFAARLCQPRTRPKPEIRNLRLRKPPGQRPPTLPPPGQYNLPTGSSGRVLFDPTPIFLRE